MPRDFVRGNTGAQPSFARHRSHSSRRRSTARRRFATQILIPVALLCYATPIAAQAGSRNPNKTTDAVIPLRVTNNCPETLWPGIGTQHGTGPGTGGFELSPGKNLSFTVGVTWQGRIWARTNCSFNADGTGPSNLNGWDGGGRACTTGDCFGVLDCEYTGATPTTLAEFNLMGGVTGTQTFYDISLVDGYNVPVGIVYIPAANTSDIPPNLTNAACVATAGFLSAPARSGWGSDDQTNQTYPMPWESRLTNADVGRWCPWDLQAYPPAKPGDGVYPYPDDDIQRPVFDPCMSACAASGSAQDCCTGSYNDPSTCRPSLYSQMAKTVCPDAYSYAFDDQTSTFIIPSGGGWEVVFCPAGRSTNILATFGPQLQALASSGHASKDVQDTAKNVTYIQTHPASAAGGLGDLRPEARMLVLVGLAWIAILLTG